MKILKAALLLASFAVFLSACEERKTETTVQQEGDTPDMYQHETDTTEFDTDFDTDTDFDDDTNEFDNETDTIPQGE